MDNQDTPGAGCGGSLGVVTEIQREYERRMERLVVARGPHTLQRQVALLQRWVRDLVAQNVLLARAVHQLDDDVSARLLL